MIDLPNYILYSKKDKVTKIFDKKDCMLYNINDVPDKKFIKILTESGLSKYKANKINKEFKVGFSSILKTISIVRKAQIDILERMKQLL